MALAFIGIDNRNKNVDFHSKVLYNTCMGNDIFTSEQFLERYVLLPPVSKRRAYTMSRLAVVADGTTVPVLRLLAREKLGEWDDLTHFPYWKDKDYHNETFTNVALCEIAESTGRRIRSMFDVPSGTKEYMKKWRDAHPERIKASQAKYRKKRQEEHQRLRQLERSSALTVDPKTQHPDPDAGSNPEDEGEESLRSSVGESVEVRQPGILDRLEKLTETDG